MLKDGNMEPNVLFAPTPIFKKPLFWLFILILILIPLISFIYKIYFQKQDLMQSTQVPNEQILKESEAPFAFEILKNPLINQWVAAVKGNLIEKTSDSITLQNNEGQTITIPLKISNNDTAMWTKFFVKRGGGVPESIDLNDIPIGSTLSGEFFILPLAENKNRIVGSQFVYDQESQ